jgi:4-hydroxy-tetrahydrodipicolinate synthase
MFKGAITALVTPFRGGQVDEGAFERLVNWQINEGIHGLVIAGTTGEAPTITAEEQSRLFEVAVAVSSGRVPIIAGIGSNDTQNSVHLAGEAKKAGADGLLLTVPYYNKPNQLGIYTHFDVISQVTDLPIIMYNIPGRTSADMEIETMAELFQNCPTIVGVKDATGDLNRVPLQRSTMGEGFCQLSGDDMTSVGFNAMGGVGCISVTSNVAPKLFAQLQNHCLAGEYEAARLLQDRLISLFGTLFVEPNPVPAKFALKMLAMCEDEVRLPMVPLSDASKALVASALSDVGIGPVWDEG